MIDPDYLGKIGETHVCLDSKASNLYKTAYFRSTLNVRLVSLSFPQCTALSAVSRLLVRNESSHRTRREDKL